MANLGLLGAVGGFGKALSQTGTYLLERRERALEAARQEAAAQRRFAERQTMAEDERRFQTEKTVYTEGKQDQRTEMQIKARSQERAEERKFRAGEREASQQFQASQKERDIEARKELARLQSSLSRENSAAAARLNDQLSADDVHAVQYGEPNAQGYAEVIIIRKDGTTQPTGRRVYRPKRAEEEGEAL